MKTTLTLFIFLVFSGSHSLAQKSKFFIGKIIYENQFDSHVSSMSNDMLNTMMGNHWDYFIMNDRYKFIMNGMHIQEQYYSPEELRLYTRFASSDTLSWIDVTDWSVEIISHELVKTEEVILGLKCNALILITSQGKETYYFSRQIRIDPEEFQKHKFLNMAYVLNYTESIPLRIVLEKDELNMVSTAVEIEPIDLGDTDFQLPDMPSKPSDF